MGSAFITPSPPISIGDGNTVEGECKVVPEAPAAAPKMTFYTPEELQKMFSLGIDEEEK